MTLAVHAKQPLWRCLREVADGEPLLDPHHVDRLGQRAQDQEAGLDQLRLDVPRTMFTPGATLPARRHDLQGRQPGAARIAVAGAGKRPRRPSGAHRPA